MAVALAVLRPLLDAEQVVGGNLRAEALEDRVAGAGHVEERAERHRRQPFEALHLDAAVLRLGGGLFADRHVAALQVERHHVDRRAGRAGQAHQAAQLVLVVERQPLRQQDERLVPVHRGELAQDHRQPGHRLVGLLAQPPRDLAGLGDDVALALRALRRLASCGTRG